MSQGLGMLLSKGKTITGLRSLIRVESCGFVRNGQAQVQVTLREKEQFSTDIKMQ